MGGENFFDANFPKIADIIFVICRFIPRYI